MPVKHKRKDGDTGPGEPVEKEPQAAEGAEGESGDLEALLAEKEEELKQAQDRVLRLAAELDNTRKRLEREKSESICYANENIMREFLPVIDNLERAIEHGEKEEGCQGLLEGVRMTLKGFLDAFAKFGGSRFESVGQPFDPNLHEAVTQEVTSEFPDMTVTREFQKGYTLRDRLLRPAMVGVARNSKEE
ncbi:MAG: nucleotide exchange factor GrpE [Syntrophobacteraceae bacterium]